MATQGHVIIFLLAGLGLLGLHLLAKRQRKEGYSPFLTGTYSDIRGKSRFDICVDGCLEWLELPPFDRKVGYCIKGCVADYLR
jgi:hypothetical protein